MVDLTELNHYLPNRWNLPAPLKDQSLMYEDLKRRLSNDHNKLDLLLEALESSLKQLTEPETSLSEEEFLQDAREDLSFILEEMFDHFGMEEEAIFEHIRTTLPSMSKALDQLEQDHEILSSNTAHLRKMVAAAKAGMTKLNTTQALERLAIMRDTLRQHNHRELQIFHQALEQMDQDDRTKLLENLQRL